MELKIKTHHALPCRTEVFTINGKMLNKMILVIHMTIIMKTQSLMLVPICTLTQSLQQRKY